MCDDRRRADDHLSLVAGIRKLQIEELKKQSIEKLESFALTIDLQRPERGNFDSLVKKQSQAKIQLEGRINEALVHKSILPQIEKRGFNRLPEPCRGDIYFDIEGDAFYSGGSLEYLFGIAFHDKDTITYEKFWATTRSEEKKSFGKLMQFILERHKQYPDLFIYHYAPYEPSSVKRLAHTHAIYEQELDDLLRRGKFVDLHAVVKEAIIASVERYSLKDIEKFTSYTREADLREAIRRENY
jgi:uncharacterized protein